MDTKAKRREIAESMQVVRKNLKLVRKGIKRAPNEATRELLRPIKTQALFDLQVLRRENKKSKKEK